MWARFPASQNPFGWTSPKEAKMAFKYVHFLQPKKEEKWLFSRELDRRDS